MKKDLYPLTPNLLYDGSETEAGHHYFSQGDIIRDLNLNILFKSMSQEDLLIQEAVRNIIMIPLKSPEQILYRQKILKDFFSHRELLRGLYGIAVEQHKILGEYKNEIERNRTKATRKTGEIIHTLHYLQQGVAGLEQIRDRLSEYETEIHAEGTQSLLRRLENFPLAEIAQRIRELHFYVEGGNISYCLHFGGGMKIQQARVLSCENRKRRNKSETGSTKLKNLYYKHIKKDTIPVDSQALKKDVNVLLEQTMEYILSVFQPFLQQMLSFYDHYVQECAFYMGAVNLMGRMDELSIPLEFPEPGKMGDETTEYKGLYELSMALYTHTKPVGNDGDLCKKKLTVITGANQGGKSTFLRSYGIAQLLMQCGLPVPATEFRAPVYENLFTHFTRREDEKLNSGRLQEELQRMSAMIDAATKNSLFLLNESFASTTEKEGSRIAEGIVRAFYEKGISTLMVTHLFEFARKFYQNKTEEMEFLVAERLEDGTRTYHMLPGEPNYTSYGTDLFQAVMPK